MWTVGGVSPRGTSCTEPVVAAVAPGGHFVVASTMIEKTKLPVFLWGVLFSGNAVLVNVKRDFVLKRAGVVLSAGQFSGAFVSRTRSSHQWLLADISLLPPPQNREN